MNIGIVCYPTYGGSGVVATELGKALAQKGHTIHFITYSRPIRLDLFNKNILYHEVRLKDYPLFDFAPYESALASTMVDVARYHKLDLFHVHYAVPHASVACLARDILATYGIHVPVVTTLHGTDITLVGKNQSYEPVVTYSIERSNGVTAVSKFLKDATYLNFNVKKNIEVIYNFVELDRFTRQDKEHFKKMITQGGQKLLVHTSNFRKVKRIQDVISMFEIVHQHVPSRLLMVGDGPERRHAEEMVRELGIEEDVYFLGSQNAVEEIYSIGDLFVIPSENESFGLSALEAMACGVPVISSNVGGLPELVQDGVNGFTSPVGDVKKMASDAITLLTDDERWKVFSENARRRAEEFETSRIVSQYEALYEQVIAQKALVNC